MSNIELEKWVCRNALKDSEIHEIAKLGDKNGDVTIDGYKIYYEIKANLLVINKATLLADQEQNRPHDHTIDFHRDENRSAHHLDLLHYLQVRTYDHLSTLIAA